MAVTDLNEIMKQAKKMQEHFQESQKELEKVEVIGESGAGLVKVHMDGRHTVFNVELDDTLATEGKEITEDLIAAAINDASRKVDDKKKEALGGMAGNFKMPPDFKFPF